MGSLSMIAFKPKRQAWDWNEILEPPLDMLANQDMWTQWFKLLGIFGMKNKTNSQICVIQFFLSSQWQLKMLQKTGYL